MLNMVTGCQVPFPERLSEGYDVGVKYVRANLNAEKIAAAMKGFITSHRRERVFFILELPTKMAEEPEPERVLHKDVYYLDNCTAEQALGLMEEFGELLVQDGMSAFGFGAQESNDEIMSEKFNLVTFWAHRLVKFKPLLEELGIPEVEELTTAWDTFDREHPGQTKFITVDGMDVYGLAEKLKERGLYFAERRKDNGTPG